MSPGALLVTFALPIFAPGLIAHAEPQKIEAAAPGGSKDDPIEDLDAIEDVTAAVAPVRPADLTLPQLFGRMHPALVHMPIGWIVLLLLFELAVIAARRRDLEPAGLYLALAALASTVPAIVSGLLRAGELPADLATQAQILRHRNVMLVVTVILATAVTVRLFHRRPPLSGYWRLLYLGLLLMSTALVALGGHYGGKMVYGEAFLPF
ncbi:MAG: DUF2231 domain-containing protein [Deltaproteobacteria bacterium]|nr:DUF2231 domain-containing protein [Deltaproteobacteria bacterium]